MRSTSNCLPVLFLVLVQPVTYGQDLTGRLHGEVTGPFDGLVVDAPIQAIHVESGQDWRGRTASEGRYEFDGLPAGNYRVRVRVPCCEYAPYNGDVAVSATDPERAFDIQLAQGFQLNTIGDDGNIATAQVLAERQVPDLPIPHIADGKPDLTGMWVWGADPFAPDPEFHEDAARLVAERVANQFIELPRIRCLPTSLPILGHTPPAFGKIIHSPGLIVILFEGILGYRQIFTDGRQHPEYPNPSWLGHSIGHWEGDTLVVDTVGFNDRGWTGLSHPRSDQFHVIEKYRRTSYGEMELELTIEDPEVYKKPWVQQIPVHLAPQEELLEFVCENDKWVQPATE